MGWPPLLAPPPEEVIPPEDRVEEEVVLVVPPIWPPLLIELVVPPIEVTKTFGLYVVLGVVHFLFRKKFLAVSANPKQAEASGLNMRLWDFTFYMLFGLVVTSFVHIGGVLLVFSYLVVPAVCATYLVTSIPARFAVGWAIATGASVVSLVITAKVDLPIGAAIVCVLGVVLVLVVVGARLWRRRSPAA